MPFRRYLLFASLFFICLPMWAQRAATGQLAQPTPTRDSQAISVLNSAVAAAGGLEAVGAIRDYRATGTVIDHKPGGEVQGVITMSGSGVGQFRLDENLPTGNRSESVNLGKAAVKKENGSVKKSPGLPPFMAGNYGLPFRQLVTLLKDKNLDVSYKGIVQVDGRSLHQIRAQRLIPRVVDPKGTRAIYLGKDFFIDPGTFQVAMIQDIAAGGVQRRISYADYKAVNGVSVPFSIDENTEGTPPRTIHLESINFNAGLQKSVFDLTAR